MKAKVFITLKEGVLDPQGRATAKALENLGFKGIQDVRIGKFIEVDIKEKDQEKAKQSLDEMCNKLFANTVVENFRYELGEDK